MNEPEYEFLIEDKPTDKPQDGQNYAVLKGKHYLIKALRLANRGQMVQTNIEIDQASRDVRERKSGNTTEHLLKGAPQPVFLFDPDFTDEHGEVGRRYPPEGGIYVYLKGVNEVKMKYPRKGFPSPADCQANNIVKRCLMEFTIFFAKNPLLALLIILRKKTVILFIRTYCSFAGITLAEYFLEEKRYSPTARELRTLINIFFERIGLSNEVIGELCYSAYPGKIISHMLDFDDAYMYRFQDIMNETSKELLSVDPRGELERLVTLLFERDRSTKNVGRKAKAMFTLLNMALLIPKIRRAFIYAVNFVDFSKLQMDEGDRYHVLRWDGYKFLGRTLEDRMNEFVRIHDGNVPIPAVLNS